MAANEAVRSVLEGLAAFCAETAAARGTHSVTGAAPRCTQSLLQRPGHLPSAAERLEQVCRGLQA